MFEFTPIAYAYDTAGEPQWRYAAGTWSAGYKPLEPHQKPPFRSGDPLTQAGVLPLFDIWMEGFMATGERDTAQHLGSACGVDFEAACRNFRYPVDVVSEFGGEVLVPQGAPLGLDELAGRPISIWGCRLFDNEAAARVSFG